MSILLNKKFASLSEKQKHKHAAILLKEIFDNRPLSKFALLKKIDKFSINLPSNFESISEDMVEKIDGKGAKNCCFNEQMEFRKRSNNKDLSYYEPYEQMLSLPPLIWDEKQLLDRIHYHETIAMIPFSLQHKVSKKDQESNTPFLEIDIYLENLRSMHNIGTILRCVEAFRLGTVYLSKSLPPSAHTKIQKTAMGADQIVSIHTVEDCLLLKRPLIAIETIPEGENCNTFAFPKSCTLLFGNEQYGLSDETLAKADHFIHIPLYGNKNSLNVSQAFAILANCIRKT